MCVGKVEWTVPMQAKMDRIMALVKKADDEFYKYGCVEISSEAWDAWSWLRAHLHVLAETLEDAEVQAGEEIDDMEERQRERERVYSDLSKLEEPYYKIKAEGKEGQ